MTNPTQDDRLDSLIACALANDISLDLLEAVTRDLDQTAHNQVLANFTSNLRPRTILYHHPDPVADLTAQPLAQKWMAVVAAERDCNAAMTPAEDAVTGDAMEKAWNAFLEDTSTGPANTAIRASALLKELEPTPETERLFTVRLARALVRGSEATIPAERPDAALIALFGRWSVEAEGCYGSEDEKASEAAYERMCVIEDEATKHTATTAHGFACKLAMAARNDDLDPNVFGAIDDALAMVALPQGLQHDLDRRVKP